jgi:hypothetical protein
MAANPMVFSEQTLSTSFMTETIQTCVVTRDFDRTAQGFVQAGIGPWRCYTFAPPELTDRVFRGRPGEFSMKLGLAWTGRMMWEIVQPLTGPSIYHEFLERHGEGIQHVAFACGDLAYEDQIKRYEAAGFPVIMSGKFRGIRFHYFGTEDATTTTFEIYHLPPGQSLSPPDRWYPSAPPQL